MLFLLLALSTTLFLSPCHAQEVSPDEDVFDNGSITSDRLWDIGEPDISWSGFRVDMDYIVRNQVDETNVRILLFRNEDCTNPISTGNDYVTYDLIPDLTTPGDGTGTRKVNKFVLKRLCIYGV